MHKVTQSDRDAAASLALVIEGMSIGGNDVAAIRSGFWDRDTEDLGLLVQAFARHRIEAQAELLEALEECRAKIDALSRLPGGTLDQDCLRVLGISGTAIANATGAA